MNVRSILITALRFINQLTNTRIQQQSKEDAHIFSTQHISCQFRNVENVLYLYDAKNYFIFLFDNFCFCNEIYEKIRLFFTEISRFIFRINFGYLRRDFTNSFRYSFEEIWILISSAEKSPVSNRLQKKIHRHRLHIYRISELVRQVEYVFNECFKYTSISTSKRCWNYVLINT